MWTSFPESQGRWVGDCVKQGIGLDWTRLWGLIHQGSYSLNCSCDVKKQGIKVNPSSLPMELTASSLLLCRIHFSSLVSSQSSATTQINGSCLCSGHDQHSIIQNCLSREKPCSGFTSLQAEGKPRSCRNAFPPLKSSNFIPSKNIKLLGTRATSASNFLFFLKCVSIVRNVGSVYFCDFFFCPW